MVKVLKYFEQASGQSSGLILISPAIAAAVVGTFVRLGGVGFRECLPAIAGGLSGALAAG